MTLIAYHVNVEQTKYGERLLISVCGNCPGVLQVRVDKEHSYYRTKIRVATEYLSCRIANKYRQECERCI